MYCWGHGSLIGLVRSSAPRFCFKQSEFSLGVEASPELFGCLLPIEMRLQIVKMGRAQVGQLSMRHLSTQRTPLKIPKAPDVVAAGRISTVISAGCGQSLA